MLWRILFIIMVGLIGVNLNAQEKYYNGVFSDISSMLSQNRQYDFKNAVFLTENAYYGGALDKESFDNNIKLYSSICKNLGTTGNLGHATFFRTK